MAIKPVVGYTGSGWNYPVGTSATKRTYSTTPKAPSQTLGGLYTGGYGGSGWNYPIGASSAIGSYKPLPAFTPPAPIVQPTQPTAPADTSRQSVADTTTQAPAGYSALDNYLSELTNDPMYRLAESNYSDALAMGQRSQFGDPFRQALIQYGRAPTDAELAGLSPEAAGLARQYLDQGTIDAATGNPYSTTAQINRTVGQSLASIPALQAMRGMTGGGGARVAGNQLDYQSGLQRQSALNSLLGQIGTANQNWVNYQNQAAATRRGAQEDVATRLAQIAGYHAQLDAANAAAEAQRRAEADRQAREAAAQASMPDWAQEFSDVPSGENAYGPDTYVNPDYSGGPGAIYQPTPDVAELMAQDHAAGQWDAWANAMQNLGSTAKVVGSPTGKPATSNATQKLIQKMRSSGQTSAWAKAMQNLGSA